MSKKDDRRKNRKEKRERSRVKRASYLHAGSLKPIDLPEGVNLYDYMKDAIRTGKTTDIMLRDGIDLDNGQDAGAFSCFVGEQK
jgi:hypothetical protein